MSPRIVLPLVTTDATSTNGSGWNFADMWELHAGRFPAFNLASDARANYRVKLKDVEAFERELSDDRRRLHTVIDAADHEIAVRAAAGI